MGIQSLVGALG